MNAASGVRGVSAYLTQGQTDSQGPQNPSRPPQILRGPTNSQAYTIIDRAGYRGREHLKPYNLKRGDKRRTYKERLGSEFTE
jgi:hypothetical protein